MNTKKLRKIVISYDFWIGWLFWERIGDWGFETTGAAGSEVVDEEWGTPWIDVVDCVDKGNEFVEFECCKEGVGATVVEGAVEGCSYKDLAEIYKSVMSK